MSWNPPPISAQSFYGSAKLLAASVLAKGAANAALSNPKPTPFNTGGMYKRSFTQTKMKYAKKKVAQKDKKPATIGTVRRMIRNQSEIKRWVEGPSFSAGLVANSVYSFNMTAQIAQGTLEGQRIGEEIHLTNVEGTFTMVCPTTAGPYQYRFLIVYSKEDVSGSASNFSTSGLSGLNVFQAGALGFTTAPTNPKACTVLFDRLITINSNITAIDDAEAVRFNIPLKNKKLQFQEGTSAYGKWANLFFVVVGQALTSGTPPGTLGVPYLNASLAFRDS